MRGSVVKWVPAEGWGLIDSPGLDAPCRVERHDVDLPDGDVLRAGDPVEFSVERGQSPAAQHRARGVVRWLEPLQGTTGG